MLTCVYYILMFNYYDEDLNKKPNELHLFNTIFTAIVNSLKGKK